MIEANPERLSATSDVAVVVAGTEATSIIVPTSGAAVPQPAAASA
jgi:hypothetical protein